MSQKLWKLDMKSFSSNSQHINGINHNTKEKGKLIPLGSKNKNTKKILNVMMKLSLTVTITKISTITTRLAGKEIFYIIKIHVLVTYM